jgi:hypothetical protein
LANAGHSNSVVSPDLNANRDYPGAYRSRAPLSGRPAAGALLWCCAGQTLAPQVLEPDYGQPAAFVAQFLAQLVPRLK